MVFGEFLKNFQEKVEVFTNLREVRIVLEFCDVEPSDVLEVHHFPKSGRDRNFGPSPDVRVLQNILEGFDCELGWQVLFQFGHLQGIRIYQVWV